MLPLLHIGDPLVGNEPQVGIRLEIFHKLLHFGVVCDLLVEQTLTAVEPSGVLDTGCQCLVNEIHLLSDLSVLLPLIVHMELCDSTREPLNGTFKLFLLNL